MKRLCVFLLAVFVIAVSNAQSPQLLSYQAVIRNSNNTPIVNQQIGVRISILQGSVSGSEVYSETQSPTTNSNGLISMQIGGNTGFELIEWGSGIYFIKTETDPDGGVNYTITAVSQLLSVPYALHAKTAEFINGEIEEVDPMFTSSIASGITASDTANWNNGRGDNTESDPVFSGWDKNYEDLTNRPVMWDSSYASIKGVPTAISDLTLNADNNRITSVASPTENQDAATKAYVDLLESKLLEMESKFTELEEMLIVSETYKVMDVDSNFYNVVKIGEQIWMKENLRTTRFNNGDAIELGVECVSYSESDINLKYWTVYNEDYYDFYGFLYSYFVTIDERGVCPTGWRMPNNMDWTTLIDYLGGENVAGGKLKLAGEDSRWSMDNIDGTNESGFSATAAGAHNSTSHCPMNDGVGFNTGFWSSTESTSTKAYKFSLYANNGEAISSDSYKVNGFSVRCIKE